MKYTVRIPLIEGGENTEKALELQGARFDVCHVNWPESFPYAALCTGCIARPDDREEALERATFKRFGRVLG